MEKGTRFVALRSTVRGVIELVSRLAYEASPYLRGDLCELKVGRLQKYTLKEKLGKRKRVETGIDIYGSVIFVEERRSLEK